MSTKISIGIQARSSSNRLPNKVHEIIAGRPMICHVVAAARSAAVYINRYKSMGPFDCSVSLLIPSGDSIGQVVKDYYEDVSIIEGDELDVLSRYKTLLDESAADWVVRLTGDCPLIPPYLISKAILEAYGKTFHYISNAYPEMRLSPDGWDCEVVSKRLLQWVHENASDKSDREHVTTLIKSRPPGWAHMGLIHGFLDMSELKYSVDSEDDLMRVRAQFEKIQRAENDFKMRYHGDVVRF